MRFSDIVRFTENQIIAGTKATGRGIAAGYEAAKREAAARVVLRAENKDRLAEIREVIKQADAMHKAEQSNEVQAAVDAAVAAVEARQAEVIAQAVELALAKAEEARLANTYAGRRKAK